METILEDIVFKKSMSKLFHVIRLIDIENKGLYSEQIMSNCGAFIPKFKYDLRDKAYLRCMALDEVVYYFENEENQQYLFVIFPTCAEGKTFVTECVANITGKTDINICPVEEKITNTGGYKLSIIDDLTEVYNRRYINQTLPIIVDTCFKKEVPLSIIFADLDYFKKINDSMGHITGDYLLQQFAKVLKMNVNKDIGWVARYGGDEFLLCLPGVNNLMAKIVAERIRKATEEEVFLYNNNKIKSTCSLGVCTFSNFEEIPSVDSILRRVDNNLYKAKNNGRNSVI